MALQIKEDVIKLDLQQKEGTLVSYGVNHGKGLNVCICLLGSFVIWKI